MLFDLNGNKFMVKFSRAGTTTFAELWMYRNITLDYDCLNILGIAECSPKDIFEKSKGRKVALAKLFIQMNEFYKEEPAEYWSLGNNKEDRAKIWEIYFKEHKK
jgi:hypothetical protein